MNWRITAALTAIAGILLWIAYRDVVSENPNAGWQEVLEEPRPTPPAQGIERLVTFDAANVSSLAIRRKSLTASTKRSAYGWSGTSKPRAVNEFLEGIADLAVILRIDESAGKKKLQAYGLDNASTTVELQREDNAPIHIAFGQQNPSGTGIYAKVSGTRRNRTDRSRCHLGNRKGRERPHRKGPQDELRIDELRIDELRIFVL